MPRQNNDADLRFNATLEDNVSPQVDTIVKKMQALGASKHEIKIFIKAYDEASVKAKQVQENFAKIPKEHHIRIVVDHAKAMADMQHLREVVGKPIEVAVRVKDNLAEDTGRIRNHFSALRNSIANEMANIPILPKLANLSLAGINAGSVGLGLPALAAGGAVAGVASQSFQAQAQREMDIQSLNTTLKSLSAATAEMSKVTTFARLTPFNQPEVLQSDITMRAYGIRPSGAVGLPAAGNLAAGTGQSLDRAMLAIVDAVKRGDFRVARGMGLNVDAQSFAPGGRFQGMSVEQGLGKLIDQRFGGAMDLQAKTFHGLMSNVQDVIKLNILTPAGRTGMDVAKQSLVGINEKITGSSPQALDFQRQIGKAVDEINAGVARLYSELRKGKAFFDTNLKAPLMDLAKLVAQIGAVFASTFGQTVVTGVKYIAQAFVMITEPLAKLVNKMPILAQAFGLMKGFQMLGMDKSAAPFERIFSGINPLTFSVRNLIGGVKDLIFLAPKLALLFAVKNIIDMKSGTDALTDSWRRFGDEGSNALDRLQVKLDALSGGLGQSAGGMKKLVAGALNTVPGGTNSGNAMNYAVELAIREAGAAQAGFKGIEPLMLKEGQTRGIFTKGGADVAAEKTIQAVRNIAEELGVSFKQAIKDATEASALFGAELRKRKGQITDNAYGTSIAATMLGSIKGEAIPKNLIMGKSPLGVISSPQELVNALLNQSQDPSAALLKRLSKDPNFDIRNMLQFKNMNRMGAGGAKSEMLQETYGDIRQQNQLQKYDKEYSKLVGYDINLPKPASQFQKYGVGINTGRLGNAQSALQEYLRLVQVVDNVTKASEEAATSYALLQVRQKQLSQSQEELNEKMAAFQFKHIIPIQREMERLANTIARYQQNTVVPIARAQEDWNYKMLQTSRILEDVSFRVGKAQYNMTKYSESMLTGDQAINDQIHSLDMYAKRIEYMRLLNTGMMADITKTNFTETFKSVVKPLAGFSLERMSEQVQRRKAMKELEQDIRPIDGKAAGDWRYEIALAQRTGYQAVEMDPNTKLDNIKKAAAVITEGQKASRRLTDQQHEQTLTARHLEDQMRSAQVGLRKYQDQQYDLGQKMFEATQKMHGFEDAQRRIAHEAYKLNRELFIQEQVMNQLDTLKDLSRLQAKSVFDFITSNIKDQDLANMRSFLDYLHKAGILNDNLWTSLNDHIQKGPDDRSGKAMVSWFHRQFDQVRRDLIGIFSTETFLKIKDMVSHGFGSIGVPGIISGAAGMAAAGYGAAVAINTGLTAVTRPIYRGVAGAAKIVTPDRLAPAIDKVRDIALSTDSYMRAEGVDPSRALTPMGRRWLETDAGQWWSRANFLRPGRRLAGFAVKAPATALGYGVASTFLPPGLALPVGVLAGAAAEYSVAQRSIHPAITTAEFLKNRAANVYNLIRHPIATPRAFAGEVGEAMGEQVAAIRAFLKDPKGFIENVRAARADTKTGETVTDVEKEIAGGSGAGRLAKIRAFLRGEGGAVDAAGLAKFAGKGAMGLAKGTPAIGAGLGYLFGGSNSDSQQRMDIIRMGDPTSLLSLIPGLGKFQGALSTGVNALGLGGHDEDYAKKVVENLQKKIGMAMEGASQHPAASMRKAIKVMNDALFGGGSGLAEIDPKAAAKVRALLRSQVIDMQAQLQETLGKRREYAEGLKHIQEGINTHNKKLTEQGYKEVSSSTGIALDKIKHMAKVKGHATGKEYADSLDTAVKAAFDTTGKASDLGLNDSVTKQLKKITNPQDYLAAVKSLSADTQASSKDKLTKQFDDIEKNTTTHLGKMQGFYDAYYKNAGSQRLKTFTGESSDYTTHSKTITRIVTGTLDPEKGTIPVTYNQGWQKINTTTHSWLGKVEKQVKNISEDLGLTSPIDPDKKAHGGMVGSNRTLGRGKQIIVGEEGHPEVVIPLAPHRRDRAMSLIQQTLGHLSGAQGQAARYANGGWLASIGGQQVDRRIIPDLRGIMKKYHVALNAGYSLSGHKAGGEHPMGLAVDIVPGAGGNWDLVDNLAHWAEPQQNHPRFPFRWVGYDGDPDHGRGNHLHLSWMHTGGGFNIAADAVETLHGKIGGVGALNPAHLKKVPKGLQKEGFIGQSLFKVYTKQRQKWIKGIQKAVARGVFGAGVSSGDVLGSVGTYHGSLDHVFPRVSSNQAGETVSDAQVHELLKKGGFPNSALDLFTRIEHAESGARPGVVNSIGATGLWQIYNHPDLVAKYGNMRNPWNNVRAARDLSSGGKNTHPWDASRSVWSHAANGSMIMPGALAGGISNVPRDNFPALLHKGESVLTAHEARSHDFAEKVSATWVDMLGELKKIRYLTEEAGRHALYDRVRRGGSHEFTSKLASAARRAASGSLAAGTQMSDEITSESGRFGQIIAQRVNKASTMYGRHIHDADSAGGKRVTKAERLHLHELQNLRGMDASELGGDMARERLRMQELKQGGLHGHEKAEYKRLHHRYAMEKGIFDKGEDAYTKGAVHRGVGANIIGEVLRKAQLPVGGFQHDSDLNFLNRMQLPTGHTSKTKHATGGYQAPHDGMHTAASVRTKDKDLGKTFNKDIKDTTRAVRAHASSAHRDANRTGSLLQGISRAQAKKMIKQLIHIDKHLKHMDKVVTHMAKHIKHIDKHITHMDKQVTYMAKHVKHMDKQITHMAKHVAHMDKVVGHMAKHVKHIDKHIAHMDKQVTHINKHMTHMDKQVTHMGKHVVHMDKSTTAMSKHIKHMDKVEGHILSQSKHMVSQLIHMSKSDKHIDKHSAHMDKVLGQVLKHLVHMDKVETSQVKREAKLDQVRDKTDGVKGELGNDGDGGGTRGRLRMIYQRLDPIRDRLVALDSGFKALYPSKGFAGGINYVSRDNMPALLHQGEMVLQAGEAQRYRGGGSAGGSAGSGNIESLLGEMVDQLHKLNEKPVGDVQVYSNAQGASLKTQVMRTPRRTR